MSNTRRMQTAEMPYWSGRSATDRKVLRRAQPDSTALEGGRYSQPIKPTSPTSPSPQPQQRASAHRTYALELRGSYGLMDKELRRRVAEGGESCQHRAGGNGREAISQQ